MQEKILNWSNVIIECNDRSNINKLSDLCQKKRARSILVKNEFISESLIQRSLLKGSYIVGTHIKRDGQSNPGLEKFNDIVVDVFDLDTFEISPMDTDNHNILLQDLRICSDLLINRMSQLVTIGWNLTKHKLTGGGVVKLLDSMIYGYKPNYIRFGVDQEITANTVKKALSIKTALPYNSETSSDYIIISNSDLDKA
jgi:hypothetical protein